MGAQKNYLNEMVLLSTQNMFLQGGKKIITILGSKYLVIWTCSVNVYPHPIKGLQ